MPNQLVADQTGVEIPREWKDALNEVRETFPDAIIAGGALRDLYCGKEVKDLDFFAHPTPSEMPIMWSDSDMEYAGMQYVLIVYSRHDKSPPQNLIIYDNVPSIAALLESFDFGICQIGYDGSNILVTSAFLWDFKYGVFTMRHSDRVDRSRLRYARINERYNWPLIEMETAKCPA